MSDKARRFFSADSLDRAVLDAASHYGVAPEELRYELVDKRGLAKRRRVVIRIDPETPTGGRTENQEIDDSEAFSGRAESDLSAAKTSTGASAESESAPGVEPHETAPDEAAGEEAVAASVGPRLHAAEPPVSQPAAVEARPPVGGAAIEIRLPANAAEWFELLPEADVEERVAAERWTTALLDLAGLELTPRVRQGDSQLEVHLSGPDAEWLAEDDGEILLAIQHLLPRVMQSDLERLVSCRVDCGGFQLLHEERLRARAHWAAEEVRSEGRAVTLEPMPPADRRIIHLALVNDATVDTESLGRGFFKRVSVRPA